MAPSLARKVIVPILAPVFLLFTLSVESSSTWQWNPKSTHAQYSTVKVYLFSVTNPGEATNGSEPRLEELGPYVYRERRVRFNISSTSLMTVKYHENKTYQFVPDESKGSGNELMNFVNIPLVSALSSLLPLGFLGRGMIDTLIKSDETFIREDLKAGDVLYDGIDVKLYLNILGTLGQAVPAQMAGGTFALFKGQNGTDDGEYEVQPTPDYLHSRGEIVSWRNKSDLGYWGTKECNKIKGTDGNVFAGNIGKETVLYFFNPEVCRPLPLVYQRDEEFKGIPAYRFIFSPSALEYAQVNEENTCYCRGFDHDDDFDKDFSTCLKKGVIDQTLCKKAPLASSFPHFLDADTFYLDKVQGLKPNRELHESFIVVEPNTGTVLNSSIKFQLNVQTSALAQISTLKKIPDYLFPIMWIDKSFTLGDEAAALLKVEKDDRDILTRALPSGDSSQSGTADDDDSPSILGNYSSPQCSILSFQFLVLLTAFIRLFSIL